MLLTNFYNVSLLSLLLDASGEIYEKLASFWRDYIYQPPLTPKTCPVM